MAKKKAAKTQGGTVTLTAAEVRQVKKALAIVRRVRRADVSRARIRAEG